MTADLHSEGWWQNSDRPDAMWDWLYGPSPYGAAGPAADKARLFACACARACWHALDDERSRVAVQTAEAFALGRAGEQLLARALDMAWDAAEDFDARGTTSSAAPPYYIACACAATDAYEAAREACVRHCSLEPAQQADMLREVFGEFLDPPAFDRRWATPDVVALARAAESCRRPDGLLDPARLAVLADALEEAGCPPEEGNAPHRLLAHLRGVACPACGGCGKALTSVRGRPAFDLARPCHRCHGAGVRPHPLGCWAVRAVTAPP